MEQRSVRVIRPGERGSPPGGQTPGMEREEAVAGEDVWVGLVTSQPGVASGWHHHGQHDTYAYVLSGAVRIEHGPAGSSSATARAEDFLVIPAGTVHRETGAGDGPARVVVVRVGSGPATVNVDGPEPA